MIELVTNSWDKLAPEAPEDYGRHHARCRKCGAFLCRYHAPDADGGLCWPCAPGGQGGVVLQVEPGLWRRFQAEELTEAAA